MEIGKIRSVNETEDSLNVLVDVEFDVDVAERWELTDPVVSVVYNLSDELDSSYMELLDRGLNVHGFELSYENQEKILKFLSDNNITN